MAGLILGNPGARYFGALRPQAYATVGVPNTIIYGSYGALQAAISQHIPVGLRAAGGMGQYYDFILIAGHGSMNEATGAPIQFADLSPVEWATIVAQMLRKGMVAPVIILDGCKTGAFAPVFEPLARPYNHAGRHFSLIVCNLADSSFTVLGNMAAGQTLAAAIQGKMNLEITPARPAAPIGFLVPAGDATARILENYHIVWDGAIWRERDSRYPVSAVVDDFDTWLAEQPAALAGLTNHQSLLQRATAARPHWTAALFRPTAVIECTVAGRGIIRMCGPFSHFHFEEDVTAAYDHWQRNGPGGVPALVFQDEIMRMLERLDGLNFEAFDNDGPVNADVAALTTIVTPAFARPAPRQPRRPRLRAFQR